MDTSRPVAGWYRDPSQGFEHRYWNGAAWTPHVMTDGTRSVDFGDAAQWTPLATALATVPVADVEPEPVAVAVAVAVTVAEPATGLPPAPRATTGTGRMRWPVGVCVLVLGGAALLFVGALLPWAEAQTRAASFSRDGIAGDGVITVMVATLVPLAFFVVRRPQWAAGLVLALALIAGAVGAYDVVDTSRKADDLVARTHAGVSAGVGIGLWVTLVGAGLALLGGALGLAEATRHPPGEPPAA